MTDMGFFHPEQWRWAGLAVLIALLYLWNFARGRHEVATFWLWQRALARRPAWLRLQFWLSLAAQIVILLLLVAALAEPYWKTAVAGRRTLVLVLDVSASMSATDVKPTRLAAAQAEALRIVQGLQPGEPMTILTAGSVVRSLCRWTDDPQALQAAIDTVKPTDGTTRMTNAVELARRLLDGKRNPKIVLLTDGCFPQAAALAKDEQVYLKRFGQGGRNLAITHLAARPDPLNPTQQLVLIETANDSESAAECQLPVSMEGGKAQTTTVKLPAGAVAQTTLSVPAEKSGVLTARLTDGDDLAADNTAHLIVAGRPQPSVFFVPAGQGAPDGAVQAALESVPAVNLQVVERLPDKLPPQAVAVLHRQVPQRLPACPVLVIAPQGPCELWEVAGAMREAACAVKDVQRDSPLLTDVRFEDIVVEEAVKLTFKQPAETLIATATGDSLYSRLDRSAGPVLVLHVDLDREKSDLALRAEFPILVRQAVRFLSGTADADSPAARTDVLVSLQNTKGAKLVAQDGRSIDLPESPQRRALFALDAVGVWPVEAAGDPRSPSKQAGTTPVLPVNLASRSESGIRAGANVPSRDLESPAPTRQQPLWVGLAGAAAALLLIEWCLFHRRVVV
ncbi:MAG TPA: VWA domain-containing protein [Candidatus Anammoximicrobium sp.]|nr:VWA domain-containing protein [Candidatus Anammoximicrobium sp.]